MGKLEGKVALITGGNSGIGLSIAQEFSRQGAKIVIFGRNSATLAQAENSITGEVLSVKGDIRSNKDLTGFVEKSMARYGKIDIVVANAGGAIIQPFLEVSEDAFDYQSDANFKGTFFTIQKAAPYISEGGTVIIVSSSANCRAAPGMSVYGPAKAAVRALARTLTLELAPKKIRVNVLTPGPVRTPAYHRTGLTDDQIVNLQQEQVAQIPLNRIGDAEEMATAALFLASPDSSFVAGAELVADGGMTQI